MRLKQSLFSLSIIVIFLGGLGGFVQLPEKALTQTADPVFVGAGDIADCSRTQDESTAKLLDNIAGTVFTLGDNVYPDGTTTQFKDCYGPSWGRHKDRTKPAAGNHDYSTAGAAGYYSYFGATASPLDTNCTSQCKGYYSYNLGAWHIIVLNSEINHAVGSPQENWLRADLAGNQKTCTLAYWHKPRFSSGGNGNDSSFQPLWQALYDYGADLVLNGHEHMYERFAPQSPTGQADPTHGIRQFIVGTGGAGLYTFSNIQPNSEVRNGTTWGVLKLTLHATSYSWEFIPIAGQTFTDAGSSNCVSTRTTFADVPASHPYYSDIEALYANGLTGGCNITPLMFCPDQIMDRAQASVFMMRGTHGAGYVPNPADNLFQDDWSRGAWARPWAESMRETGLTSGCRTSPLLYCPWAKLPREQVVIFGLKMKYGNNYLPPPATGTVFADMTDPDYYATSWAEKAYADGLIQPCGSSGGKPNFCPRTLVSRGLGAYVIVRARNLTVP
jgi:hypothetical protein